MKNEPDNIHRPHLRVAAGILFNAQGEFLLASRPEGKAYAGYWEFPGGKLEAGETPLAALIRELDEEMGITITEAYPWLQQTFDYPHAHVTLFFFQVTDWTGTIHAREGQNFVWQNIAHLTAGPILPANGPILRGLALPRILALSQVAKLGEDVFLARLQRQLENGLRWLILREPQLDTRQYAGFAQKVLPLVRAHAAKVLFHSHLDLSKTLEADGVHFNSKTLMQLHARPEGIEWCGASVHTLAELQHAGELGLDYAMLGHIHATPSHPGQPGIGWQGFARIVQHQNRLPVFGIGGLQREDIAMARAHGAQGVALLRGAWCE